MDRLLELLWTVHDSGFECIVDGTVVVETSRNYAKAYSSLSFRLIIHDGVTLFVPVICYHLLETTPDCQLQFYWSSGNSMDSGHSVGGTNLSIVHIGYVS